MRFSIAAAGFIHMAAAYSPELAYPLASMQQDMERLGFGEAKNDPCANFDRCDYGAPCMNTTIGCAKGQCARRHPHVTPIRAIDGAPGCWTNVPMARDA